MIKAAIYCRLSDEDRNKTSKFDESESIQNQKTLLTKYAIEKGWDIYKIYSDDDYSGLDCDRPEFNQMIKDAESGKFNIVLCKNQKRFTRDMEIVEKYLHNKFIEWGIRFIGLTDNADTSVKGNKKQRQINGLVNEWYCEEISEDIRAVFDVKRNEGKFIGSFATYGYKKDPNDKNRLIVDEPAAKVIKMIYNWYLEGYGTQHIAYILNEQRISNPTKYKQENGLNFKNSSQKDSFGLWNKTTVKRILRNEIYVGNMVQAKRKKVNYKSKKIVSTDKSEWITVLNTHQAIIDEKVFQEVQRRLDSKVRSTGEGKAHIFATKIRCMDCGSTMNKVSTSEDYMYLRCKLYAIDPKKELCTNHSIRLDRLIDLVTEKIKYHIERYFDNDRVSNKLFNETEKNNKVKLLQTELNKIKRSINENATIVKNLYVDKIKGVITEEQFLEFNKTFAEEKETLILRQEKIENAINEKIEESKDLERYESIIKKYRNFKELSHTMVNELIDYIEIGEKNPDTKEQKVKIHWLF